MNPVDLQAMAESVKAAKDYADAVVKPSLSELGGLLSDTVGYWRVKNRVNILLKTKKLLEDRGIEPTKLLPDVFVPLIDEAGNTEDETLSDMFARLLATHLDPAQQDAVHPSFSKTLGQLSPLDAQVLWCIDEKEEKESQLLKSKSLTEPWAWSKYLVVEEMKKKVEGLGAGRVMLSLANLERLGILKDESLLYDMIDLPGTNVGLVTTMFGKRLLVATAKRDDYWRRNSVDIHEIMFRKSRETQAKVDKINEAVRATATPPA